MLNKIDIALIKVSKLNLIYRVFHSKLSRVKNIFFIIIILWNSSEIKRRIYIQVIVVIKFKCPPTKE